MNTKDWGWVIIAFVGVWIVGVDPNPGTLIYAIIAVALLSWFWRNYGHLA